MSAICEVLYSEECPCEYSPSFREWENNYDRDRAIEETGCIPDEKIGTTLPIVGNSQEKIDFQNQNFAVEIDSIFAVMGVALLFRIFFKK